MTVSQDVHLSFPFTLFIVVFVVITVYILFSGLLKCIEFVSNTIYNVCHLNESKDSNFKTNRQHMKEE